MVVLLIDPIDRSTANPIMLAAAQRRLSRHGGEGMTGSLLAGLPTGRDTRR